MSVWISRRERAGGSGCYLIIDFPWACSLACAARFLLPSEASTAEKAYRSISCSSAASACDTYSFPSKARPIYRMANSNGIFWLKSRGGSTKPTAASPTAKASSSTASTASMKLVLLEYSANVEAKRYSLGAALLGESEAWGCCGRLMD